MNHSRPDIAYAVGLVARYRSSHWKATKQIFQYVKGWRWASFMGEMIHPSWLGIVTRTMGVISKFCLSQQRAYEIHFDNSAFRAFRIRPRQIIQRPVFYHEVFCIRPF